MKPTMMNLCDSLPFFLTTDHMSKIFWKSVFLRSKEGMKSPQIQDVNRLRDKLMELPTDDGIPLSESEACQVVLEIGNLLYQKNRNLWNLIDVLKKNGDLALLDEVFESTLSKMPEGEAVIIKA